MKKVIYALCAAALVALTACGGAQAQTLPAQPTLQAQVQWSTGKTVDIAHARAVDVTAGANSIIDANGVNVGPGAFVNLTAFTGSAVFPNYIRVGTSNLYYNVSQMTGVDCVGSNTVLKWVNGTAQNIADSCTLYATVNSYSRR